MRVSSSSDAYTSSDHFNWFDRQQRLHKLELQDAAQLTSELQLLRVTRNLQQAIKAGGQETQAVVEVNRLERQVDQVSQNSTERILEVQDQLVRVQQKLQTQVAENERLEAVLIELHDLVKERRKIAGTHGRLLMR